MNLKHKKFSLIIENDNFIVRDHRVHDVRILPGVTFLDIIYRLLGDFLPQQKIELKNILFKAPVATSPSFDKRILVDINLISQQEEGWKVVIASQKITKNKASVGEWEENAVCELFLSEENTTDRVNISELKQKAINTFDMDDVYAYGRSVNINHYCFMKTLGTVYQGYNNMLMELSLGEEARSFLSSFHAHPAFLDGATFSWVATRLGRYAFNSDAKPYIPLTIKKFRIFSPLPEICYVYSKFPEGSLAEIEGDISSTDIEIFDGQGKLLVSFEELVKKRIRSLETIRRLVERDVVNKEKQPDNMKPENIDDKKTPSTGSTSPRISVSKPEQSAQPFSEQSSREAIELDLRQLVARTLERDTQDIPFETPFYDIGLDSTQLLSLVDTLENKIGEQLYPTLLFEYSSIKELTEYFVTEYAKPYPIDSTKEIESLEKPATKDEKGVVAPSSNVLSSKAQSKPVYRAIPKPSEQRPRDVAIIGLSGRYPQSPNKEVFWQNIAEGKNCITEIPQDHWEVAPYFNNDPLGENSTYSKWGGFIEAVECFDPLFFSISPSEAEGLDPQLRLLLEVAWHTLEDAGYVPKALKEQPVGVYVGVMNDDHTWRAAEHFTKTGRYESFGNYAHELANRISYFMDFTGPSLTLETACSSSSTAIHMARKAIIDGECDTALAGGVNLSLHPSKYMMLSQLNILSPDGVERTFDKQANGYVPGEGVGLVMLKSLPKAIADRDHIYGVIKGSAINHSGRGSGQYVPNIKSLAKVVEKTIEEAGIEPEQIGYIETHGTGTVLGDPIELKALANVFNKHTDKKQFCALGSKANLGHLESASGICALTKVVLSMQNNRIPLCANVENINPAIPLESYPFYIPKETKQWKTEGASKVAGINSFGIGGSNSFMLVEEYTREPARTENNGNNLPALILLSAIHTDQLETGAKSLLGYLKNRENSAKPISSAEFLDIAYTLQTGRQAMEQRLSIIAKNATELIGSLERYLHNPLMTKVAGQDEQSIFQGNGKQGESRIQFFNDDEDAEKIITTGVRDGKLAKLADLWVNGKEIHWEELPQNKSRYRVPLPTYPFIKERYSLTNGNNGKQTIVQAALPPKNKIDLSVYLRPVWKEALQLLDKKQSLSGPVLILDFDKNLKKILQASIKDEQEMILVKPGKTYKETNDHYEIRVGRKEDYLRLIASLNEKDIIPKWVVHRWCQQKFAIDEKNIKAQLNKSLYSLFYLTQAFIAQKRKEKIKLLCLYNRENAQEQPIYAGLSGFIKTLYTENPKYDYQLIEIDQEESDKKNTDDELLSEMIFNECQEKTERISEVRYQGGKRWLKHWQSIDKNELMKKEQADNASSITKIREQGIYVITGGAGGLGLIFARHLVEKTNARVILLGRSKLNEENKKRIQKIKKSEKMVSYVQTDVANKKDLKQAINGIKKRYGKINGIIHSAGTIEDALVHKKEVRSIEGVIAPKVYGTIYLDLLTKDEDLDFFVMFSSITSVLGNLGQSDYAYANGFMDSYSMKRESLRKQGKRSGKTLAINWPLWKEGGMVVEEFIEKRLKKTMGLVPLNTETGIIVFENVLKLEGQQIAIITGERNKLINRFPFEEGLFKQAEKSKVFVPGGDNPQKNIEEYLKQKFADVLKIAPHKIETQTSFQEYGLDSIHAIKMIRALSKDFGKIPKNIFFDYNNIAELARYLVGSQQLSLLEKENKRDGEEQTVKSQDSLTVKHASLSSETRSDKPELKMDEILFPSFNENMIEYENLTTHNLLDLFNQGKIEHSDSACMACYPHDMLAMMNIKEDSLFKALHVDGEESLFLRVYKTHLGKIAQILIPVAQEDMFDKTEKRKKIFLKGLELAGYLGAKTISLQQTLPSVTDYGHELVEYIGDRTDLPVVSTGHSVTISAIVMMIDAILQRSNRDLSNEVAGFLGLGSIGASTLRLMLMTLPHPKKILLCDVYLKKEHLEVIEKEIREELGYQGTIEIILSKKEILNNFYYASLIVGATNVPDVLDIDQLKSGTLIVDDSAPHCFDLERAFERLENKKDILFTEGGVLESAEAVHHLRYAPDLQQLIPDEATPRTAKIFREYTYEQAPHEILGCALAGLLNTRFPEEIRPTLGLIGKETSLSAYKKIKELDFSAADLRCRGQVLNKSIVNEFKEKYGQEEIQYETVEAKIEEMLV